MADFNLPTFEQLLAARKGIGLGSTAQAGVEGAKQGLNLADVIKQRQLEAQRLQMEQEQKKQDLALKIQQAVEDTRKTEAGLIPTSSLSTSAQKMLPGKTETTPEVLKSLQPKEVPVAALSAIPGVDPKEIEKIATLYPSGMMPESVFNTTSASLRRGVTTPIAEVRRAALQQSVISNVVPAASKNKVLKDSAIMIFQDERLQALNDFAKGNPTAQEVEEMAISFDRILRGGGVVAVSEVERLVPKSAMASGMQMVQWLTGEPQGGNQQALVKRLVNGAKRETDVAKSNIQRELNKMKIAIAPDLRKDPEFMKVLSETIAAQTAPEEHTAVSNTNNPTPTSVLEKIRSRKSGAK